MSGTYAYTTSDKLTCEYMSQITSNNTLSTQGKNNSLPKFLKLMRVFKSHTDAEICSKCSKLGNKFFECSQHQEHQEAKFPNSRYFQGT